VVFLYDASIMNEWLPASDRLLSGQAPTDARRVGDLCTLLEVSRQLSATTDLGSLLSAIERSCLKVLDCERTTIFLYDSPRHELYSWIATGLGDGNGTQSQQIRFSADRGIAGDVLRTGSALNIPDAYADSRFNPEIDRKTGFTTRNLLTCPLLGFDGSRVGVLQVLNKRDGTFSRWDEELVQAFGAQAGVAVQRHLLLEEYAEKRRIEADLAIARGIQQQLLPARAPVVPGFELAGWNRPADQTGGDFYDYQGLEGGQVAITLADVTGHGIGPALLAAECRALLRSSLALTSDLPRVVPLVNDLLAADVAEGRFVTAFIGLLHPEENRCVYISAGQGPIFFFQRATGLIRELPTSGVPLGILPGMSFDSTRPILFDPGDLLLLCTDGFVEWPNASGERWGNEAVHRVIQQHHHLPAADLIAKLYQDCLDFAAGAPQKDDLTAVVVKRLEAPSV
jgi:phosphoserine phosphatase